jgi:hypothetical protein
MPVEKNIVFRTRSPSLVDTIPLDLGDRSRPVVFFQDRIARRGVKPLARYAAQAPSHQFAQCHPDKVNKYLQSDRQETF